MADFDKKEKLIDYLNPDFLDELQNTQLDYDPLKIIDDEQFTASQYQEASVLKEQLSVQDHDFSPLKQGKFLFDLHLANGFLHFEVKIKFSRQKVEKITVNSMIRNFSTDAFKIVALIEFLYYFMIENPTENTNSSARIVLNHFAEDENRLPVKLRAQFDPVSYSGLPVLTFKIGQDSHLYKLQSLPGLVDSVRDHHELELGKYFNRTVEIDDFDDDSLAWYRLIESIINHDETVQIARDDFSLRAFKELPINESLADQIDQLMARGVTLYHDNRPIDYSVSQDRLQFKIRTDTENETARIKIDYLVPSYEMDNLIEGNRAFYYFWMNSWTKYENVDPIFLKRYGLHMGEELTFGAQTLQTLGHKILPKIKKSGNFSVTGMKKLVDTLPPEAEIIFNLDFQDREIICTPVAKYGEKEYQLEKKANDETEREFEKEKAAKQLIEEQGFTFDKEQQKYSLAIDASDRIDAFFDDGINQLKKAGQVKATAAFKRLLGNLKTKFNVSLGIRLGENTLDLTVSGEKLAAEDIQAILNAYQQKRHYFMLRNGQMKNLESPSLEDLSLIMKNLGISLKQFVKGKMTVPAYRAFYLEKMLENRDSLQFTSNDEFDRLIADLEQGKVKKNKIPASLKKVLRPYQVKGYQWMTTLLDYNLGGLLADEMGLGKTLQVISFLLARKAKTKLPSLIVVPASVVYNWEAEIKKFAPELETIVLGGSKKERREQLERVTDQVLITSYDSLKRDLKLYEKIGFDLEVIDEAQNIKNAKAAVSKAVKIINARHRLALTGTPIENNLSELWSIFDYLMPGFLGEYEYFRNNYEKPIVKDEDKKKEKQLSQIIVPFVLRRLKKDVLKDLPEKDEQVIYAKLSGRQDELYQAQTQKLIAQLNKQDDKDFKKQRFQVLAAITKLRELCCDPHLLYEDYRGKSAKLAATMELIEDSIADGHKILLFSQFTSMLELIEKKLKQAKIVTFVITGSTPKQKRQELIKQFNKLDHPAIFLISLKAGGTGINLTSADVVIHYDPWWNVAAENQATDRAHRIGQKHNVQIYKMVAKGTIEEKIVELQERKEKLADEVLSGEDFGSSTLDRADLLNILER